MVELGPLSRVPGELSYAQWEALSRLKPQAEAYRKLSSMQPAQRRRLRESAGVSLEKMAAACDTTAEAIASYELDCTPKETRALYYWGALQQLMPAPEEEENLAEEERRKVVALFEAGEQCRHCGGMHSRSCPRVKSLKYHPGDGSLAEVEFWADDAWPKENIIFRDSPQLAEPEDTY